MVLRDKIILWALALIAFSWFLHSIQSILIPFGAAIIIAYFLDPLADRLEKFKLSRSLSALIILSIFIAVIVILGIVFIPIFYKQFISLINEIPNYSNKFLNEIYPSIIELLEKNGYKVQGRFNKHISEENLAKIFDFSNDILTTVMQSSVTVLNVLSLVFITPILVFYLLKDWNLLVHSINKYLPAKHSSKIRKIFIKIDKTLSGYIRGQFNVCLILGVIYAIGLEIVGLNFGFAIGFLTGVMSFVPYVGMLIGVAIALIIALFQWGLNLEAIGLVGIVFFIGQVAESNFLTPKLVGKKIGLHPVWVIFSVFAFGVIFGFIGVVLAVPMAAILGVLIKFIAEEYRKMFVRRKRIKKSDA